MPCDFGYGNNGENLYYNCHKTTPIKRHKVNIKDKKVYINNKLASLEINTAYLHWLKSKKENTEFLRNKKDSFNCF